MENTSCMALKYTVLTVHHIIYLGVTSCDFKLNVTTLLALTIIYKKNNTVTNWGNKAAPRLGMREKYLIKADILKNNC